MKLFKYINQAGGIFAALFFLIMVGLVRRGIVGKPYYIVGGFFLAFASMFLITACILMFRSLMWHIRRHKLGDMLRHYVYAYVGFYILLMVIDHITMGSISWGHNFLYALIAAMIQVYLHGYKLEFNGKKAEGKQEKADV